MYPKLSCFVKIISVPVLFLVRKNIKHGFGVHSKNSNSCKHQCGYICWWQFLCHQTVHEFTYCDGCSLHQKWRRCRDWGHVRLCEQKGSHIAAQYSSKQKKFGTTIQKTKIHYTHQMNWIDLIFLALTSKGDDMELQLFSPLSCKKWIIIFAPLKTYHQL